MPFLWPTQIHKIIHMRNTHKYQKINTVEWGKSKFIALKTFTDDHESCVCETQLILNNFLSFAMHISRVIEASISTLHSWSHFSCRIGCHFCELFIFILYSSSYYHSSALTHIVNFDLTRSIFHTLDKYLIFFFFFPARCVHTYISNGCSYVWLL